MKEKTHQEWSNYQTWAVCLWIDKQPSLYGYWRTEAARHRKDAGDCQQVREGTWTTQEAEKTNLADQLEDEVREQVSREERSVHVKLVSWALNEVDWKEVATHFLAELPEHDPATTRAHAIDSGRLIDVTPVARELNIKHPTAVSAGAWAKFAYPCEHMPWLEEAESLWDILWMTSYLLATTPDQNEVAFAANTKVDGHTAQSVPLKAVCGQGDDGELVLTIMLPEED